MSLPTAYDSLRDLRAHDPVRPAVLPFQFIAMDLAAVNALAVNAKLAVH